MSASRAPAPTPPAVSILMPSFDQASYLEEAIASIGLEESHDVELIVADGGSTDGSLALLVEAARRHPGQVRWSSAPDGGPAEAVNRALAQARGAVVGWLNSDDVYTPGAVARARAHLATRPRDVMVYGHGEHIDARGRVLSRYPTVEPSEWVDKARDGCGLCQPTAFMRREVLQQAGGLDTSLRTAFDFDLWLRLFRDWPHRIACLNAVQARSRLHPAGITLSQRRRVALEALRVLSRHTGTAPMHWLQTWFEERIAGHPWSPEPRDLAADLRLALTEASSHLGALQTEWLAQRLERHVAVRVAGPGLGIDLSEDGWTAPRSELRFRQPLDGPAFARIWVDAEQAHPRGGPMRLQIHGSDGSEQSIVIPGNGPFTIELPISERRPGGRGAYIIECLDGFRPSEVEPGSTDARQLGVRVHALRC
jgi:hypothetical protein